jgi:hypothetical protein
MEVPFVRITVTKGVSPWRRRNGDMPVAYFGRAALRKDQCGMVAESQTSRTEKRQQLLCNGTLKRERIETFK